MDKRRYEKNAKVFGYSLIGLIITIILILIYKI